MFQTLIPTFSKCGLQYIRLYPPTCKVGLSGNHKLIHQVLSVCGQGYSKLPWHNKKRECHVHAQNSLA
jgi:hypothetical protein